MRGFLEKNLLAIWYGNKNDRTIVQWILYCSLIPLTALTYLVVKQRFKRRIYQGAIQGENYNQALGSDKNKPPIIVVGNITVGGTGKSPLLLYLARYLISRGYRVGIVSRGYGAVPSGAAAEVSKKSLADEVGDEPLMLFRKLNPEGIATTPVVACTARDRAVALINKHYEVDLILSDDGLQHYAMPRAFEIAVIDGQRSLGNMRLLPAGPLREPLSRLEYVDYVLVNGERRFSKFERAQSIFPNSGQFAVVSDSYRPLNTLARVDSYIASEELDTRPEALQLSDIVNTRSRSPNSDLPASLELIIVAGIGNPERFFNSIKGQLQKLSKLPIKIKVTSHVFTDHHRYELDEFNSMVSGADSILVMTEKDAVKCEIFAEQIQVPLYAVDARVEPGEGMTPLLDSIRQLVDNAE